MEKIIDKSDNLETYYHFMMVDGYSKKFPSKRILAEEILIQVFDIGKINFDNRPALIRICHQFTDSKSPFTSHELLFCVDLTNHQGPTEQFHLNFSGKSKEFLKRGGCPICKKYFLPLDHFELIYKYGEGTIPSYKIIQFNGTLIEFEKRLKASGFLKLFSELEKTKIS